MRRTEQLLIFISVMLVVITVNVLLFDLTLIYFFIKFVEVTKEINEGTNP